MVQLAVEFLGVFFVVPTAFAFGLRRWRRPALLLPGLWIAAGLAYGLLVAQPLYGSLWALPLSPKLWGPVALRFSIAALASVIAARTWVPAEDYLRLPRRAPGFWLVLLLAYPLLSAIPQGLVWRVLLVTRYSALFAYPWQLLAVGGVAFAAAHLVFRNPITLLATGLGGVLFLHTYLTTGSALLASLEHGAYGALAFTVGFGKYFYLRANMEPTQA